MLGYILKTLTTSNIHIQQSHKMHRRNIFPSEDTPSSLTLDKIKHFQNVVNTHFLHAQWIPVWIKNIIQLLCNRKMGQRPYQRHAISMISIAPPTMRAPCDIWSVTRFHMCTQMHHIHSSQVPKGGQQATPS